MGEILKELNVLLKEQQGNPLKFRETSPHDVLRRKYLKALSDLTGRATILYSTSWMEEGKIVGGDGVSIVLGDVTGFMEATSNIKEKHLDLILHSPGGSAEAAESIVGYLRTRFDHIRVIVPVAAMSAATMIVLAADEILMGNHSQLGPIDPQFTIHTPEGPRSAPAQAIKDQFDLAKKECQNPANIGAWLPILRSYLPGLIAQCDHQRQLAEHFAAESLQRYMFQGQDDAEQKAQKAAAWFADFTQFRSHGRRVSREDARSQGLIVKDLEESDELQDAVLSVFHATQHTLAQTGVVKLIENHHGRAWLKIIQQVFAQATPAGPVGPNLPLGLPPSQPAPPSNREARRRLQQEQQRKDK